MAHVLIADPNPAIRNALALLLLHRLEVTNIQEAEDRDEVMRALACSRPDLVLMDQQIYHALKIQADCSLQSSYPGMKLVLLSVNPDDVQVACQADAAFIHKGASPADIIVILQPLLGEN